jgi:hypothetical protein
VALGAEHGSILRLDQLLQAVAHDLRNSSSAVLPSRSCASSEASPRVLDMVHLAEVVLKPGPRAYPPLATPAEKSVS